MKFWIHEIALGIFLAAASIPAAQAQSSPAGRQNLDLSAFGGATLTQADVEGGRNVGITGGGDLGIHAFSSFLPSLEIRGTYPFSRGNTASDKNILGGLKFERRYWKFHPYADILFGRAQIQYAGIGLPNPSLTYLYTKSPSNVWDVGGGADFDLTYRFALKADVQFERLSTPVTTSGHIYPEAYTLGFVYRFNFKDAYTGK